MALFNTYAGWFFNEKGEYDGIKGLSKNNKDLIYKKGRYFINLSASYIEWTVIPFLWKKIRYFYNVNNSHPITLDKRAEPPISPELFDVMMETKLARDLNNLSKSGLGELLTPRNIIIAIVVVGIIIYLATGGSLWGGSPTPPADAETGAIIGG